MAHHEGPRPKAIPLYISEEEGVAQVDFGASLNTVTGYSEEEGCTRHFISDVTSGGLAEQFQIKFMDELLLLNNFPLAGKSEGEVVKLFQGEKVGVEFSMVFQRPMDHQETDQIFQCCQASGIVLRSGEKHKVSLQLFHQHIAQFNSWITLRPEVVCIYHPEEKRYFHVSNNGQQLSAIDENEFEISNKFEFQKIVQFKLFQRDIRVFFRHEDSSRKAYFIRCDSSDVTMMRLSNSQDDPPRDPEYAMLLHGLDNGLRLYAFEVQQSPGNYVTLNADQVVVRPSTISPGDDVNLQFRIDSCTKYRSRVSKTHSTVSSRKNHCSCTITCCIL